MYVCHVPVIPAPPVHFPVRFLEKQSAQQRRYNQVHPSEKCKAREDIGNIGRELLESKVASSIEESLHGGSGSTREGNVFVNSFAESRTSF